MVGVEFAGFKIPKEAIQTFPSISWLVPSPSVFGDRTIVSHNNVNYKADQYFDFLSTIPSGIINNNHYHMSFLKY